MALTLHAVDIDNDMVLLDVDGDAYFCIPGAGGALRDLRAGHRTPDAAALTEEIGARLASTTPPSLPTEELEDGPARVRLTDVLHLLGAWWDLVRRYHGKSFAAVLSATRPEGAMPSHDVDEELRRLARVFQTLAIWVPASGKCLVRSFLLLRFLQRSGRDAAWVFGVRTWPFSAHCWLQAGGLALDDAPERLLAYTPIHAV